jgi:hypothetical protein
MKRFLAVAVIVGVLDVHFRAACADNPVDSTSPSTAKSPLAVDGELQKLRDPLLQIFQFQLEADNLKFDRSAWETAAAEIEKKNAAAAKDAENLPPGMDPESPQGLRYRARLLEERAQQLERQQRMGASPPFLVLLQNLEDQSRHGQRSTGGATGYSSNGKQKSWRRTFDGKTLSGEVRSDNDGEGFTVRESELPNRTLELSSNKDTGFRIEISDPAGDAILLRQCSDGFSSVTMTSGMVHVIEGKTFVDAYRRSRAQMDTDLLPVLARFGICPEVSPGEPVDLPRASEPKILWNDSRLFSKGELQEYRGPLANIFKFAVADGQLKIDHDAWKQAGEAVKKEFAEAAEKAKAQLEAAAQQNAQGAIPLQQSLIVR